MKIDVYAHIMPANYKKALDNLGRKPALVDMIECIPTLVDLDQRFRIMDRYQDLIQVLTLVGTSPEEMAGPKEAVELAMRANDEMAELVFKYPDRFAAATAVLPMNNIDAAIKEIDRAVNDLKLRGILIRTPINGKPVDLPEFMPIYEKMSRYHLPIWFHPQRRRDIPEYATETESKYHVWHMWGLPFETTVAMTRLVFSGVLEKYPDLKIITHHCGAMVPFFEGRIRGHYDLCEMRLNLNFKKGLTKPLIEYFRMFYNDTSVHGSTPALMCGYAFFGADHILFGTDMPMDSQIGARQIRDNIEAVEQMDIPDSDRRKIFEGNARNLLRLPI